MFVSAAFFSARKQLLYGSGSVDGHRSKLHNEYPSPDVHLSMTMIIFWAL